MTNKKWIIVDRDGTLIVEKNYLHCVEDIELLPGAAEGLRLLEEAGCNIIVASNQSGVGRGYFSSDEVVSVNNAVADMFKNEGANIKDFFFCPHKPSDNCCCRKPLTGLAEQAMTKYNFSVEDIVCVIGDKSSDIGLGKNLGRPAVLVMTGYGNEEFKKGVRGTYNTGDLSEAAFLIIKELLK